MFSAAGRLSFWFPTDRSWVCSAPFDMGITDVASDETTAARILARPDLEALPLPPAVDSSRYDRRDPD